jgi:hypothetical protein
MTGMSFSSVQNVWRFLINTTSVNEVHERGLARAQEGRRIRLMSAPVDGRENICSAGFDPMRA